MLCSNRWLTAYLLASQRGSPSKFYALTASMPSQFEFCALLQKHSTLLFLQLISITIWIERMIARLRPLAEDDRGDRGCGWSIIRWQTRKRKTQKQIMNLINCFKSLWTGLTRPNKYKDHALYCWYTIIMILSRWWISLRNMLAEISTSWTLSRPDTATRPLAWLFS